ncbi:MAG TPA: hypothetical protein VKU00_06050, partial [Chthonomonadaceae bacterium]|nr:hypothetical protein [Chthonomonadaceae bacterium]
MIAPRQAVPVYPQANDGRALDLLRMPNHILSSRNRQYAWRGIGSLSIKTFWEGRAFYNVGDGHFVVDESSYLLLNHEQPYAITIDSDVPVESFCLFFGAEFAADALYALSQSSVLLLDMPEPPTGIPACFYDRTYPHDDLLSPLLFALRQSIKRREYEALWLEEQ